MFLHVTERDSNRNFQTNAGHDPHTLIYWTSLSDCDDQDAIVSLCIEKPGLVPCPELGYIFISVASSVREIVTKNIYPFGTDFVLRSTGTLEHKDPWRLGLFGDGIAGALEYMILRSVQSKLPNNGVDFIVRRQMPSCVSSLRKKQLIAYDIGDRETLPEYLEKLRSRGRGLGNFKFLRSTDPEILQLREKA